MDMDIDTGLFAVLLIVGACMCCSLFLCFGERCARRELETDARAFREQALQQQGLQTTVCAEVVLASSTGSVPRGVAV